MQKPLSPSFTPSPLESCQVGFPLLPVSVSKAFNWSLLWLFVLVAVLLVGILVPNNGVLSFVLDDPFIHLRLAENIWQGHYGINLSEPSSPSSSILWPYLLSPFAAWSIAPWVLLFINILLAVGVLYFVAACVAISFSELSVKGFSAFLFAFCLFVNLPALIFVGMEHVLQLLLCSMLVYALLDYCALNIKAEFVDKSAIKYWFWLILFLLPLVRYENSLLVAVALLFVFASGFYWQAIVTGLCIAMSLLGFSWFLHSLDLAWLPSSILLKSSADLPLLERLAQKLSVLVVTPKAWCLVLGLGLLLKITFSERKNVEKLLALCLALFVLLFLLLGSFGWYYRYEAFAWMAVALVLLFLYRDLLNGFISLGFRQKALALSALLMLSIEHIAVSLLVPVAANNIYLQQYQMGRFVRDFYQAPIAVNDIGLVAYLGDEYVLDLWGLASQAALQARTSSANSSLEYDVSWMQSLAEEKSVGLAMIYFDDQGDADGWFEKVPASWQRLGSLTMQAAGVSVSKREVVFFSTDNDALATLELIKQFEPSLPALARFEYWTEN